MYIVHMCVSCGVDIGIGNLTVLTSEISCWMNKRQV